MPRITSSQAQGESVFIVYVIVNTINNKCYVGITSRSLVDSLAEHISRAKNGVRDNRLCQAMRKYGFDSFKAFVEQECINEYCARIAECAAIYKYDSCENGYNCNLGGHGNLSVSEITRCRISISQRGKVLSPETRAKMSAAKLGDKSCINNLGAYAQAGNACEAHAKSHRVEFPDGHVEIIYNLAKFCRENGLSDNDRVQLIKGSTREGYRLLEGNFVKHRKSRESLVLFPDGHTEVVNNFTQFCRDQGISSTGRIYLHRGRTVDGYRLLRRSDGHPEREYPQARGSGSYPVRLPSVSVDLADMPE